MTPKYAGAAWALPSAAVMSDFDAKPAVSGAAAMASPPSRPAAAVRRIVRPRPPSSLSRRRPVMWITAPAAISSSAL